MQTLENLINDGYIRKVISPCSKYYLLNYTDKATFEKCWNEYTINARGTIYDIQTGEVKARAFKKFWNHEELPPEKQAEVLAATKFTCFEKVDGSLGVLAYYGGEWRITTRGSFTSDQAIKAQEMLSKYDTSRLVKNFTYLVEIIYPENKIIVNYGDEEKLVYLGAFDTATGIEILGPQDVFPTVRTYEFNSVDDIINTQVALPWTDEGFVLRLSSGERVKFKSKEYMKIAKIKANMSPLTFWEKMKEGDESFKVWFQSLPEELRDDGEKIWQDLAMSYSNIECQVVDSIRKIAQEALNEDWSNMKLSADPAANKDKKRAVGIYLKSNPVKYGALAFPLIDGNYAAVRESIYKEIRPDGNVIK